MSASLLEVEGLTVQVRHTGRILLSEASITVRPGQIIGLVGESGSGKTTFCRAVTALLPGGLHVTSGSIRLRGNDVTNSPAAAVHRIHPGGVAMVFQDPSRALNPVIPIGRQITEALHPRGRSRHGADSGRAAHLLESMGMEDAAQRLGDYPHQLSGGQRQRVVLAIALAKNPALLIADEPTSAVDVSTQAQILELLVQVAAERDVGVLIVTHDFGVVSRVANDVVVMYEGKVVETGPTVAVLSDPQHPYTRGLIDCVPSLTQRRARLPVIPSAWQAGSANCCPFFSRCAFSVEPTCDTDYAHVLLPTKGEPAHSTACVRQHQAK